MSSELLSLSVLISYRLATRLKGLVEQYEVREEVSDYAMQHSSDVMIYFMVICLVFFS